MFRHGAWPHGLGILFHAMEYPKLGDRFDVNLGFCQLDSPVEFDEVAWNHRNWLYHQVPQPVTISGYAQLSVGPAVPLISMWLALKGVKFSILK